VSLEGLLVAGLPRITGRVWCNPLFPEHFSDVLEHFGSHERLAWYLFMAPKGTKFVNTQENVNNDAVYNAGNLLEFIYIGVYKRTTRDGTLFEFVIGRHTLPYTIGSGGILWRAVSVLSFKQCSELRTMSVRTLATDHVGPCLRWSKPSSKRHVRVQTDQKLAQTSNSEHCFQRDGRIRRHRCPRRRTILVDSPGSMAKGENFLLSRGLQYCTSRVI
jgi:hypothetical protein